MNRTADTLRKTTEEMANLASVDMDLWQRHSAAALRAADELESVLRFANNVIDANLPEWHQDLWDQARSILERNQSE